jgi:TolB-like protein
LIRADTGYVVWSETYDRPLVDILMVQDDIAGEVTKALRASIGARPER